MNQFELLFPVHTVVIPVSNIYGSDGDAKVEKKDEGSWNNERQNIV